MRVIKPGGGRKLKLSIKEPIILTLVYLHHLQTFPMLGVQFAVSESTEEREISLLVRAIARISAD